MKYTTILFDSDDTLLDFKASEHQAIYRAFEQADLPFDEEKRSVYSHINHGLWKALERGEITTEKLLCERFRLLFERYGYDYDPARMNDLYFRCLSETAFTMEGAVEILEYLYGRYELDIITNGVGYIQTTRLDNADIRKYIRHLFISGEIGASKPDKAFFDYVLSHIDEKDRSRILVIGDSLTSDIKGAINVGLDCVYIGTEPNEATYCIGNIKELRKIL
ncbi:MAG: YjjG family noncanonical pyrimidine nucleotidase [Clostridia bacterium]|nr:YjjG family noncanonical pyrimidine nucleotidase [Clostridia bacterium]